MLETPPFPPPTAGDLLRAAAVKLQANAEGATNGPFDIEIDEGTVHVANYDGVRTAFTGTSDEPTAVANALHYATWPPEAAPALAGWLAAAADRGDGREMADALALAKVLLAGLPLLDEFERAHA